MGPNKKKSKGKSSAESPSKEETPQNVPQQEQPIFQSTEESGASKPIKSRESEHGWSGKEFSRSANWDDADRNSRFRNSDRFSQRGPNSRGFSNARFTSSRANDEGARDARPSQTRYSEPMRKSYQNEEERPKRYSLNDHGSNRRGMANNDRQRSCKDPDFIEYEKDFYSHHGKINYTKVAEITQDLFRMSEDYCLAHCVAEDMNMGSGIAVPFRRTFRRVDELLNQHQSSGGLAILKCESRYVYYLVTKPYSWGKPTYETLFSSLKRLRDHVVANGVGKIAMPRIGCGLDRLEWDNVKFMVEFVFREVDVEIVVCNLEPTEDSPQQKHKNCRVTHELYPIEKIDNLTIILYFSSEDEHVSDEMKKLDEKFHFLSEFRHARKRLGDAILYTKNQNYLLCGCIVRQRQTDHFDFTALQKCLSFIQKENKKLQFEYYAFQAIRDPRDRYVNNKIINILRNTLRDVDVYVCWPGDLQNDMAFKDRPESKELTESWKVERGAKSGDWRARTDTSFEGRNQSQDVQDVSWNLPSQPVETWGSSETNIEANDSWFEDSRQSSAPEVVPPKPSSSGHHPDNSWEDSESAAQAEEDAPVQSINHKFETFKLDLESDSIDCSNLKEQQLPSQYSLVCFAREDFIIDSGVPVGKDITTAIGKLLNQKKKPGDLAVLSNGYNFLYFLVVSPAQSALTQESVFRAIEKLQQHAGKNGVQKLVIPVMEEWSKDLKWSDVKCMFEYILGPTGIAMTLMSSEPSFSKSYLLKRNGNKLNHTKSGIHQMKKKTIIVYFASSDGAFTEEMMGLGKRFKFGESFKTARKVIGGVIKYREDDYVVCGCVVRESSRDDIDFEALQKCLSEIHQQNQTEKLPNFAVQALNDGAGSTTYKIITILLHCLKGVTISVCWPGELRPLMPT